MYEWPSVPQMGAAVWTYFNLSGQISWKSVQRPKCVNDKSDWNENKNDTRKISRYMNNNSKKRITVAFDFLHLLYGLEHSKWCSERYVRKSLPHAKNLDRSVIDAVFNDSWIFVTFSQLRCVGVPHDPPIFSRTCTNVPAKQIVTNGFSYVWLLLVQMGFFSNMRRGDEHALTCAFRPKARYVSCNVQPPSWSIRISMRKWSIYILSSTFIREREENWSSLLDFVQYKLTWL